MIETRSTQIIQPGIYDVTNEDYHNGPGISRTGICEFMKTPLHYWERYINPFRVVSESSTAEMAFGSAFHLYVLENHLFDKYISIVPKVDKRTTAGKAAWAQFQANSFGKTLLEEDDYQHILRMTDRVMSNTTARSLIEGGQNEKSIYYIDAQTGTLCKTRPDVLKTNFIVDLKTAKCARNISFKWDIKEYGYHIQAGMMCDGVNQVLKSEINDFIFIVVEKEPPYPLAIYPMHPSYIEMGREIYRQKLIEIIECKASNNWPGNYESEIITP